MSPTNAHTANMHTCPAAAQQWPFASPPSANLRYNKPTTHESTSTALRTTVAAMAAAATTAATPTSATPAAKWSPSKRGDANGWGGQAYGQSERACQSSALIDCVAPYCVTIRLCVCTTLWPNVVDKVICVIGHRRTDR